MKEIGEHRGTGKLPVKDRCTYCTKSLVDPWILECGHEYCEDCLGVMENKAIIAGKNKAVCRECKGTFSGSKPSMEIKETGSKTQLSWIGGPDDNNILPSGKTIYVKAQIVSGASKELPLIFG